MKFREMLKLSISIRSLGKLSNICKMQIYYLQQSVKRKPLAEIVTTIEWPLVYGHALCTYARLSASTLPLTSYPRSLMYVIYVHNSAMHKEFEFRSWAMATSYEPKRCSAYSDDLRWRMVYKRTALGLSYREIAANLCGCFYSMQNSTAISTHGKCQKGI